MASTGAVVLIILAAALVNAAPTSSKHNIREFLIDCHRSLHHNDKPNCLYVEL